MKHFVVVLLLISLVLVACNKPTYRNERKEKPPRKVREAGNTYLETGWYFVVDEGKGFKRVQKDDTLVFYIDPTPIIVTADIAEMNIDTDQLGRPSITMKFDEEATKWWADATEMAIGKQIACVIDDEVVIAPRVMGQIPNGLSQIATGQNTEEELREMIKRIMD
jgi:hypothetical protein